VGLRSFRIAASARARLSAGSGRDQTSINVCLSITKRGEAAREDVGSSNEIPQRFLVRIGNHESFGRVFCPTSLDHRVLFSCCNHNSLIHLTHSSPLRFTIESILRSFRNLMKLPIPWDFSHLRWDSATPEKFHSPDLHIGISLLACACFQRD